MLLFLQMPGALDVACHTLARWFWNQTCTTLTLSPVSAASVSRTWKKPHSKQHIKIYAGRCNTQLLKLSSHTERYKMNAACTVWCWVVAAMRPVLGNFVIVWKAASKITSTDIHVQGGCMHGVNIPFMRARRCDDKALQDTIHRYLSAIKQLVWGKNETPKYL